MTFAEKIASYPGLLRYHIMNGNDTGGQAGNSWGHDIACWAATNEINWVHPVFDPTVLASGYPSLKFTQLSQSSSGAAGQWGMRFDPTLPGRQFGQNETFNVQWMERRSRYLNQHVFQSAGPKHAVIGRGDSALCDPGLPQSQYCSTTSSSLKLVMQNVDNYGIPKMYNDRDVPFEQYVAEASDFDLQPHQGINPPLGQYCSYRDISGGQYNRHHCFAYNDGLVNPTDEFMRWNTMTVQVSLGSLNAGQDLFVGSNIKAWGAWLGDVTAFKWLDFDTDLPANGPDKYGRVWFFIYQTSKQASEVHETAIAYYANVIVAEGAADPNYLTTDDAGVAGSPLALVLR